MNKDENFDKLQYLNLNIDVTNFEYGSGSESGSESESESESEFESESKSSKAKKLRYLDLAKDVTVNHICITDMFRLFRLEKYMRDIENNNYKTSDIMHRTDEAIKILDSLNEQLEYQYNIIKNTNNKNVNLIILLPLLILTPILLLFILYL